MPWFPTTEEEAERDARRFDPIWILVGLGITAIIFIVILMICGGSTLAK